MMAVEEDDEEDMADLTDVEDLERVFSDMAPPWERMENCWKTQTEISSGFRNNNTETLSG
jgi:tRNA A58 N-methylase Trm61